jgi:prepilin-type N-terminal cleavage/methylation domain-containing protein
MRRAFTIIELLVAIGILAVVLSFAGAIFRVGIDAHRTALANAEIMQKFRVITEQLNSDLRGLRKDGQIFVVWVASSSGSGTPTVYERLDRIMFFADGDFQSYKAAPPVRGNLARICYILAKTNGTSPKVLPKQKRILARTQHILTADARLSPFRDPNTFTDSDWYAWNDRSEYDRMTLQQWLNLPWPEKQDMLSVIMDVNVDTSTVNPAIRGAEVNPNDPNSIHMLLCQGVGEFKIQSWYDAQQRWLPEVDPDANGDLADSEFYLTGTEVPGVLYPYGAVVIRGITFPRQQINEDNFARIPGLGRALKFTFTLYDSKGIIKQGRTFTHIVYLDNRS